LRVSHEAAGRAAPAGPRAPAAIATAISGQDKEGVRAYNKPLKFFRILSTRALDVTRKTISPRLSLDELRLSSPGRVIEADSAIGTATEPASVSFFRILLETSSPTAFPTTDPRARKKLKTICVN
jgi:hypothetical protein